MQNETDITYTVVITATARAAVREQVRFIALEQQSPRNAADWLDRVWTCISDLEFLPIRHGPAEGYEHFPYVVRRVVLDNHLILFTVDKTNATVYVLGLRHGARQPRPHDLPRDLHAE